MYKNKRGRQRDLFACFMGRTQWLAGIEISPFLYDFNITDENVLAKRKCWIIIFFYVTGSVFERFFSDQGIYIFLNRD